MGGDEHVADAERDADAAARFVTKALATSPTAATTITTPIITTTATAPTTPTSDTTATRKCQNLLASGEPLDLMNAATLQMVCLAEGGDRYALETTEKGSTILALEPKQTYVSLCFFLS